MIKRIATFSSLAVLAMGTLAASAMGSVGTQRVSSVRSSAAFERTPFEVTYNAEAYYGEVTCHGTHLVSRTFPNGKDTETCTSVTGKLAHMFAGSGQKEFENSEGGKVAGWNSDFNGALSTNFTYSVGAKLKSFHIVAIY